MLGHGDAVAAIGRVSHNELSPLCVQKMHSATPVTAMVIVEGLPSWQSTSYKACISQALEVYEPVDIGCQLLTRSTSPT